MLKLGVQSRILKVLEGVKTFRALRCFMVFIFSVRHAITGNSWKKFQVFLFYLYGFKEQRLVENFQGFKSLP